MKRFLLHTPFNIYHFEADKWQHPLHNHTYFEIIFILRGRGVHHLNDNSFDYEQGDTFLLGPEDYHTFDIIELTEFCFIRFNEPFSKILSIGDESSSKNIIDTLLHSPRQSRGSLIKEQQDKIKLMSLLSVLESEYENHHSPYYEIVRDSLMRSILIILGRKLRLSESADQVSSHSDSVEFILMYIKKNIYFPSRLSISALSERFNLSPNYISIFFKKQVGQSIKQYISNYRFGLIEARLTFSKLSLSEIAHEFNFTDESHFCRQFKRYIGVTPTEFRKGNNS